MNAEKYPSLLLIKLSAAILTLVFLSGIAEVACLAFYAHKTNHSAFAETQKSFFKPTSTQRQPEKSAMLMLPQKTSKQ